MIRSSPSSDLDARRRLVERVAASSYLSRSTRLRDLLVYLCDRVLGDSVEEIREHEVGHKVFGRHPDYDTAADNIVRVHASMLRKRVSQYFAAEGRHEPLIIDIPKGNYAPVFRERPTERQPALTPQSRRAGRVGSPGWLTWALLALTVLSVCSTAVLFINARRATSRNSWTLVDKPSVRQLWSQIFREDQVTDIVLDDADLAFFQELSGRPIGLSEYFDRSYLRTLDGSAATTKIGREAAESMVLKRHSSYGSASLLWRLAQLANALQAQAAVHFARDYSFREVKSDHNLILLGNSRSNPWIEPFESRLGFRWRFDDSLGTYYPVDTVADQSEQQRSFSRTHESEPREGYASISLQPSLSGTGSTMIISGTGGSVVGSAGDFLSQEQSVSQLRSRLPPSKSQFPFFETLLRVNTGGRLPKETAIVVCRSLQR